MRKLFTLIAFTAICQVAFTQSHTYDIHCRYMKCPPGENCVSSEDGTPCPGCKKDYDNETSAKYEESKRKQEGENKRKQAEQARIEAAVKEQTDKYKEEKQITIGSSKDYNTKITTPTEASINWEIELKKIEIINGNLTIHEEAKPIKILYNKKVILSTSEYTYIKILCPGFFLASRPWKDVCPGKVNHEDILNMKAEKILLGGYNNFANVVWNYENPKIIGAYIEGDCISQINEKEFEKSATKVTYIEASINDLSMILKENKFTTGNWCDCSGN